MQSFVSQWHKCMSKDDFIFIFIFSYPDFGQNIWNVLLRTNTNKIYCSLGLFLICSLSIFPSHFVVSSFCRNLLLLIRNESEIVYSEKIMKNNFSLEMVFWGSELLLFLPLFDSFEIACCIRTI